MSKRKEIDGSELVVDFAEQIPAGDMNHLVWQAAYAAGYAKIFVASANADEEVAKSQWHSHVALASQAADLAYFSYIKIGGNEAKAANGSPTKKKYAEQPPVHLGNVEVIVERAATQKAKAIKVKYPGTEDEDGKWFPKSQIHSESVVTGDSSKGFTGELMVSQWFAEQNQLEDVRAASRDTRATKNGEEEIPF
jgi:hypothetical protein